MRPPAFSFDRSSGCSCTVPGETTRPIDQSKSPLAGCATIVAVGAIVGGGALARGQPSVVVDSATATMATPRPERTDGEYRRARLAATEPARVFRGRARRADDATCCAK